MNFWQRSVEGRTGKLGICDATARVKKEGGRSWERRKGTPARSIDVKEEGRKRSKPHAEGVE